MNEDKANTTDSVDNVHVSGSPEDNLIANQDYIVVAESGLFKRGVQYNKGDIVSLHPKTAEAFKENGDIQDVEEE